MGGLIVMTFASAGNAILGAASAGLPGPAFCCAGNLVPGMGGPEGADGPRETPRISPRRGSSCFLCSGGRGDRKSTRLNSSHLVISYAVFCLKKKKKNILT